MTSDPTGAALLRAILLDPDDVSCRLVYADWLEENGDPDRAEFIRVQVEIAGSERYTGERYCDAQGALLVRGTKDCGACRPCLLRRRERELWPREGVIGGLVGGNGVRWEYRRGFVEATACPLTQWERHGPALVLAQPVREVRAAGAEPLWVDIPPGYHHGLPWTWLGPSAASDPRPDRRRASVPQAIYGLCSGWFATEQDALDALFRACVAWARRQAGLDAPCCHCDGTGIRGSGYGSFGAAECPDCRGSGWAKDLEGGAR